MRKGKGGFRGALPVGVVAFSIFSILLIFGNVAISEAKDIITLNFGHPFPKGVSIITQVDEWFANEVEKATNGKVKIKIFWSGALGKARALPELVKSGGVDITYIVPGYYPSKFPLSVAANTIFFKNNSYKEAIDVAYTLFKSGPMADEITANKSIFLYSHLLEPYQLWSKKKIEFLSDLKGLKIRTWGPFLPKICKAGGAVGVEMVVAEWYEGIERGTVDAGIFSASAGLGMKVPEIANHLSVIDFGYTTGPIVVMNKDKWNSLSGEAKKAVNAVLGRMYQKILSMNIETTKNVTERLQKEKVVVTKFKDRDEWMAKSPDLLKMWINQMDKKGLGDKAIICLEEWQKVLAKDRK